MNARATPWVTHGDETIFFAKTTRSWDLGPTRVRWCNCDKCLKASMHCAGVKCTQTTEDTMNRLWHMLKMRICVYTTRSTGNETCNKDKRHCKKKVRCTSYKSRTSKSGVHLFAAPENSLDRRVGVLQCRSSNLPRQRVSPRLSLRFCLTLFGRFCLKIRAYCQSFSAWRWAAEVIRPLHWEKIDFECPRLSDAPGLSDIQNLSTVLISNLPHHVLEFFFIKKNCK